MAAVPGRVAMFLLRRFQQTALSLCAAAACLLVARGLALGLPHYFFNSWQTENGLPQNSITVILQSTNGYLWLGTYSGLVRFDGVRFVTYDTSTDPELDSSRVTSLYEEGGALWIGHETGEITELRKGRFQTLPRPQGRKGRRVMAIATDEAGELWQVDEGGLLTRMRDGLLLVPPAGTAPGQLSCAVDNAHRIWVARQGKLSKVERGRLIPVEFPGGATEDYVQGICAARDGGLWVALEGRVKKWKEDRWSEDLGPAPWGEAGLSEFLETRNGALAAGTVDSGLWLVLPHQGVLQFNRANGLLPQNWVRSLCEDREGNLWVGAGTGGLIELRQARVAVVGPPDHWQGRSILSFAVQDENNMWVGTEGAGVYECKNGVWRQFGAESGLSNLFAWSVSKDATGRVWVGTWGGGVFVQQGDSFVRAPKLDELRAPVQALLHGKDGATWIGTDEGLLKLADGQVTRYGEAEGLELPRVRTIAEGPGGTVWFGMYGGGLGRLSEGTLKQFRQHDGLSSDYLQCLKLDPDGTLWIGTSGGGLDRFYHGKFLTISKAQGLADDEICHIEEDGRGYFWMSSHAGIIRVSKAALNACADGGTNRIDCLVYGKGEGMPTLECSGGMQPSGCKTADGRLWFPTSKGLVVVDPSDVKANLLPPPVLVEDFRVDSELQRPHPGDSNSARARQRVGNGEDRAAGGARVPHFTIRPGRHRYQISFTGLSFTVPEKVRFRYRLDGLDSDWTDAGTKRTADYSYIPPGNYTFRVIACNNDGVWSETGAAIAFTIQPQFWQTWWFRSIVIVSAAGVVTLAVMAAMRRRMRRKFEALERQRAIERERTRIARDIHDDLGASLTRISMLSQSARSELEHSAAASDVDRIYDTARELTRAMDEIVWAVNPKHDTLDSLATYLGRFAQGFLAGSQIRCRLDVPMKLPSWPVTAEVRHNLFLAFKESLNNAVKHSGTTEVRISLEIGAHEFKLVIDDGGRGFDAAAGSVRGPMPSRALSGNGLLNMRQRLAEAGGHCEIISSPGNGAKIVFTVPMKPVML
ncbi:MAG TPA: two-component regulator propeller domain-containing protein [Verrucomicrobiae bacterium]|nr:two-component regulator propeller domain-containing protein [Verrucomicrobiae bacterium]